MTACSNHPGTLAGEKLRELLAECERLLKQADQLKAPDIDRFQFLDTVAKNIEFETLQQSSDALSSVRLVLKNSTK